VEADETPGLGGGSVPSGRTVTPRAEKAPVVGSSSNRQNVKNALTGVCLAGVPNDDRRREALEAIDADPATHFVILLVSFRSSMLWHDYF
jgi:hypothetical protein